MDSAVSGPHLKPQGIFGVSRHHVLGVAFHGGPFRPIGNDLADRVHFGAIFRAIGTINTANGDQPLTVQTELVVVVKVDAVITRIANDGGGATVNDRQTCDIETQADDAITTVAAVTEGQLGLYPLDACGHVDGDTVLSAAIVAHIMLGSHCAKVVGSQT